ncbi:50S ribosomal protein L27 [Candidatus Dojkabacteria bacterium]|nr:50S ribosomal protein L27 [Candidatus Dojkabacteria bacterium]
MSHVAAAGSARQTKNMRGKRLGLKKYADEFVLNGNIIVKQRGSVYHPGKNTKMGRDFSIYAVKDGYVKFRRMSGAKRGQYYIDIVDQPQEEKSSPDKA